MKDRIQRILNPGDVERKRQEAALAVAIVADTEDAIIAKTLDGTILSWNAGAQRIFGFTAVEMIGGPVTRLFPLNRLHEEATLIARLLNGEVVTHFETQRIRKDGQPIDVSITLSPIRDGTGKIVAVSKIARDVTEARRRERALALAAAIIQHSDDAIIAKSLDGTVISWNAGAQRIFGYSVAEMVGGPITRLFPPDRLQEEAKVIARLVSGEEITHFETQRIRKDGQLIDVSVTLSPIRDGSGKIVAVSKIARDISALQRMKERLGQVFEAVLHGLVVVSQDGQIEMVNRQLETMFGYARAELVGGSIDRLMPERYRSQHEGFFQSFLAHPSVRFMAERRELFGQRKDGTEFPVEIGLNPVPSGGTLQVLATITDVSERKATQAQIEGALREKTTLLNEIHHRVKNNLQVISSLLKMQARNASPEIEAVLAESHSRVRAMSLIHQLLYESGDLERIRLGSYLQQLVRLLGDTYATRRKAIEVRVSGADAPIYLDIGRAIPCGLIVTELVTNSYKHAFPNDAHGTILVELQVQPAGGGVLVVADDGIGIPDTAVLGQGTSLGFRLLPNLAEQLQGSIALVRSQGARYELRFPD